VLIWASNVINTNQMLVLGSAATCGSHHCQPQHKVKHYVFVASAGAYKADSVEPCHFEGDARKASAGHVQVEAYLKV
jgi:hypothetical protein